VQQKLSRKWKGIHKDIFPFGTRVKAVVGQEQVTALRQVNF